MSHVLTTLKESFQNGEIPEKVYTTFLELYESYEQSLLLENLSLKPQEKVFEVFLRLVRKHLKEPFSFQPYHERVTTPFDYYQFGLEFVRHLVNMEKSTVFHLQNVAKIQEELLRGENVVLFANHQTEIDPQLFSLALEDKYPKLATDIIFVAGDRVLTDPLAMPFSMGRNLLCIYSKRHIDNPPEKREEKLLHNQKTMRRMKELLEEGGKFIYVAPSGGRDRRDSNGTLDVAAFDPSSIEMFRLMAKQAGVVTHFYPLALYTYDLLPPPQVVEKEVGERRLTKRAGMFFSFGDEVDMQNFPGSENANKHIRREALGEHVWNLVKKEYNLIKKVN